MNKKWITIIILFLCLLLSVIAYFYWDIPLSLYCKGLGRSVLDIAEIVTIWGESRWYYMILVPAFIYFWFLAKNKLWSKRILFIFISLSASGLINTLVKWIAGRHRPVNFFTNGFFGFDHFHTVYELTSFPSGHAVTAFSLAAAVSILFPRASIVAFITAISIGMTRIILTSHYLSDVIAGAGIGILSTMIVKYIFDLRKIEMDKKREGIK
jgi:membrane-associated phospholipid phosphatase